MREGVETLTFTSMDQPDQLWKGMQDSKEHEEVDLKDGRKGERQKGANIYLK